MIRDTVTHLREEGQTVFLDAEHFFDGYRANRDYALEVLRTAYDAGAEVVALCDTNGGMLPGWVGDVVHDVVATTGVRVGIHCHNDTGCAVANSLAAVDAGATHVQGTINGYGERTGNADLVSVVANLELKLDRQVLPAGPAARRHPDRARGRRGDQRAAGLAPALRRHERLRAQGRPARVGDQGRPEPLPAHGPGRRRQRHAAAGLRHGRARLHRAEGSRAGLRPRAAIATWSPGSPTRVKEMEARGHTFEAADASFELLLIEEVEGARPAFFDIESWRVITDSTPGGEAVSEATVKLRAGGVRYVVTGEGNGPGQRARRGPAVGDRAGLPRGREVRADRLQGPHPRPGARHRRDHPGAHRDLRRRSRPG